MEKLTRKERKRLAKGKTCIKKAKNIKICEVKNSSVKCLKPFNLNNIDNNEICLDFISAVRRDQYAKGYIKGMKDLEKGTYKEILKAENKTDPEIFKIINSIDGEESLTIISGIMTWFRENCHSQGYNSATIHTKVILPRNFKI